MRHKHSFQQEKSSSRPEHNLSTAFKSPEKKVNNTQAFTPTSFAKKPSRVDQLKNSFKRCIQQFSNKKQTNREAIQEVHNVNRQVLETLSTQASEKGFMSAKNISQDYLAPQHLTDYYNKVDSIIQKQRETIALSSFHLTPTENMLRVRAFNASKVYPLDSTLSNKKQIEQIKIKIKNQRNLNQNLQRKILTLKKDQKKLLPTNGNNSNEENSSLMSENIKLRQELSRLTTQQSIEAISVQFQKLKEDNEKLRKQTIRMLKNVRF